MLQPHGTLIVLYGAQSLTPAEVRAEKRALALREAEAEEKRKSDLWASVQRLLKSPGFQVRSRSACLPLQKHQPASPQCCFCVRAVLP